VTKAAKLSYSFTKHSFFRALALERSEVTGKTRRVSATKLRVNLKLGFTNRVILLFFNMLFFFYKKKHTCAILPYKALRHIKAQTSYSRNGLFSNVGVRIKRIGKLSTFR
tara:strand:+ start:6569 stop:6898 length:330 start_codon:yes stop_codon:yes gene_type:complete